MCTEESEDFKCKRCVNGVITIEEDTGLNDDISFLYLGDKLNASG